VPALVIRLVCLKLPGTMDHLQILILRNSVFQNCLNFTNTLGTTDAPPFEKHRYRPIVTTERMLVVSGHVKGN
jgi:hypothetical protein